MKLNVILSIFIMQSSLIGSVGYIKGGLYNADNSDLCVYNADSTYMEFGESLDGLISEIDNCLELSKEQIEIVYNCFVRNTVYLDKYPNLYRDEVIPIFGESVELFGRDVLEAPFLCDDRDRNLGLVRGSNLYLPDSLYSACYYVNGYYVNRSVDSNGLSGDDNNDNDGDVVMVDGVEDRVRFYEAMLLYYGANSEQVESVMSLYKYLVNNKGTDSYAVKYDGNKIKFNDNLSEYVEGILDEYSELFAELISYDEILVNSNNEYELIKEEELPYELNVKTHVNMLKAAASLVGKVRYVWGGGHPYSSDIEGINEAWEKWNSLYEKTQPGKSWSLCIGSDKSECPIHGSNSDRTCAFDNKYIYSIEEYVNNRHDVFGSSELDTDRYIGKMSGNGSMMWKDGYRIHSFDGLDCSGYISWIFNQIDTDRRYGTSAQSFIGSAGLRKVEWGDELEPCDIVAWTTHIVMIVGKVNTKSGKVYLDLECTPNMVKFGVIHYDGVTQGEIDKAVRLAEKANSLFGGLDSVDDPHIYDMSLVGTELVEVVKESNSNRSSSEDISDVDVDGDVDADMDKDGVDEGSDADIESSDEIEYENVVKYRGIGRYRKLDTDEKVVASNGEEMLVREMYAIDILRYLYENLDIDYITGYNNAETGWLYE